MITLSALAEPLLRWAVSLIVAGIVVALLARRRRARSVMHVDQDGETEAYTDDAPPPLRDFTLRVDTPHGPALVTSARMLGVYAHLPSREISPPAPGFELLTLRVEGGGWARLAIEPEQ